MPHHWNNHCKDELATNGLKLKLGAKGSGRKLDEREIELVWELAELGLPLDPFGGLPVRIMKYPTFTSQASLGKAFWWQRVQKGRGKGPVSVDSIRQGRGTSQKTKRRTRKEWTVLLGGVPKEYRKLAREIIRHHDAMPANSEVERRDMFTGAEEYKDCIIETLSKAHLWDKDNNTIKDMRLILSSVDCEKQKYHIDFPECNYGRTWTPYSCMLTLKNSCDTKLYFWIKNGKGEPLKEHSM